MYNEEMVWIFQINWIFVFLFQMQIKLFFSGFKVYLTNQRQVLPTITLSADTKACLEELDKSIVSPFESCREPSDFSIGKPKPITQINKTVVMEVIGKAISGLLRIKGFDCELFAVRILEFK